MMSDHSRPWYREWYVWACAVAVSLSAGIVGCDFDRAEVKAPTTTILPADDPAGRSDEAGGQLVRTIRSQDEGVDHEGGEIRQARGGYTSRVDPDTIETPPLYIKPSVKRQNYPVIWVGSGDTISLKMDDSPSTMQLAGVAAPEMGMLLGSREVHSDESRAYLKELLAGQQVSIEFERGLPPGRNGHTQIYVYRLTDGLFVNGEVIRLGYARAVVGEKAKYRLKKLLLAAQKEVEEGRLGIWAVTDTRGQLPRVSRGDVVVGTSGRGTSMTPPKGWRQAQQAAMMVEIRAARAWEQEYALGMREIPRDDPSKDTHVNSYFRGDGTFVRGHWRHSPGW